MPIPLLDRINEFVINPIIGLLFALALVVFLYGVVEFIAGADSEEKQTTGRQHMIWGVIGIFIMVSVFGVLNVVCNTINC